MNTATIAKPVNMATYLDKMQGWAMQTESLLLAAQSCLSDPDRKHLLAQLIDMAHDIAREMNAGLDMVNLPKVAA